MRHMVKMRDIGPGTKRRGRVVVLAALGVAAAVAAVVQVGFLPERCPVQMCSPCTGQHENHGQKQQQPPDPEQQQAFASPSTGSARDAGSGSSATSSSAATSSITASDSAASNGGDASSSSAAGLLCGGPTAVLQVPQALDLSTQTLVAGVDQQFSKWEGRGFTLEDLLHTAQMLYIDGTHDTAVWVEVSMCPCPAMRCPVLQLFGML